MGIIFNNIERENEKSKNIRRVRQAHLSDWLPYSEATMDFSVFGGSEEQRSAVVNQAIAWHYGSAGIVVIHSDASLDRRIKNIDSYYPDLYSVHRVTEVNFVNNAQRNYMPFLGMDEASIVSCIYGDDNALKADVLRQYIGLLKKKDGLPTLRNLNRICSMSLEEIERQFLSSMPRREAEGIISLLMQNDLPLQVRADIRMFSDKLSGKIWDSQSSGSGVSIISTVKNKGVISINLASNNADVMDYLAKELNFLIEKLKENERFLLVVDSVALGNSMMQQVLRNNNSQFTKILAGPNHEDLLRVDANASGTLPDSLSRKIILFAMPNASTAEVYSEMMGQYEKIEESHSTSEKDGKGFSFFGHKDESVTTQVHYDYRMRPEELTRLGQGAVLLRQYNASGRREQDIVVAKDFLYHKGFMEEIR